MDRRFPASLQKTFRIWDDGCRRGREPLSRCKTLIAKSHRLFFLPLHLPFEFQRQTNNLTMVSLNSFMLAAIALAQRPVIATAIPPPTGHFGVGVRKEVIEHYNDHDPLAPNNISTSFLATIFYPTDPGLKNDTGSYLDPTTARLWEEIYNVTEGSIASLTSTLQRNAPFLEVLNGEALHPTIILQPGAAGPITDCHAILVSDLVSQGYTVIGLDHPYEHAWLQYPNGTGIEGIPLDYPWTLPEILALYETRLEDTRAFLDQLPALVQRLSAPINTTHIGATGHSLGGAQAIGSLFDSPLIRSGINMDGTMFGRPALNSSKADTGKPSLLLGFEEHFDESYRSYPDFQTAYWRGVRINGTVHNDFSDAVLWKSIGDPQPPLPGDLGERQVEILRAIIGPFFDYTLLGAEAPAILDGPTEEFPELWYFNGDGPINAQ